MKRRVSMLSAGLLLSLALAPACGSDDPPGGTSTTGSGASGGTGGSGAAGGAGGSTTSAGGMGGAGGEAPDPCGNGVLDAGELCDPAIPAGQDGACPAACDDGDACTVDTLAGAGCAVACESAPVPILDGDACCPPSAGVDTDSDCKPLYPVGQELTACSPGMQAPTVAIGGGLVAVGCMPDGSQQATPLVKIFDAQGAELGSHGLYTSDGYYYTDIQLSYHDGRFQAVYEYNCEDDGSWNVGWGWGCVDFREYDVTGAQVTGPLVFGETGLNGHPVLDWSGNEFGLAWVSYDDMYFRRIGANRQLVGGGPLENAFLGHDPLSSDDRDGARTRIVWDGTGYGVFSIIGYHLYFVRVDAAGTILVPLTDLGTAYSQTFRGQFAALYRNGAYFVAHGDMNGMSAVFRKIGMDGQVVASAPITGGYNPWEVTMFEAGGLFYTLVNDMAENAIVTVFDENAVLVPGKSGPIGDGPMPYPWPAYDAATGEVAIAYVSPGWDGDVRVRRFTLTP